jgi:hypothetical protein
LRPRSPDPIFGAPLHAIRSTKIDIEPCCGVAIAIL